MEVREELKYTKTHEWVRDLGDGVYEIGSVVNVIDFLRDWMDCCTDDSLKDWVGRIPIKNAVHFVADRAEAINNAPYEAWLIRVKDVTETVELLDAAQYQEVCEHE